MSVHMKRMWTKEHRERHKAFERWRYPTDLTDEEWERIRPLLAQPARRGRKPKVKLREILHAIRYLARTGCGWRMLPHDFGPWQTVYWWFRRSCAACCFRPCTMSLSCWTASAQAGSRARRLA